MNPTRRTLRRRMLKGALVAPAALAGLPAPVIAAASSLLLSVAAVTMPATARSQQSTMSPQPTTLSLGTATPGGGFPLYGAAFAQTITESDASLVIQTRNTKGSTENIPLIEAGSLDMALVTGEPFYEAINGVGRAKAELRIITAMYSTPGMFVTRGDSTLRSITDLLGKPVAFERRRQRFRFSQTGVDLPYFCECSADTFFSRQSFETGRLVFRKLFNA